MSEFFEPPPPRPVEPAEPYVPPPWVGPPRGILPGVVALEMVIAQTEEVAVCVSRLAGYPTGFEFELRTLAAPGHEDLELDPIMFGPHRHGRRGREQELEDDVLRFGVQFADGSKATNVAGFHSPEDPPDAPVMHSGGGGGGGGDWRQTEWVWPLPPPGPLSFVCEWPAAEIPLTRAELDARIVIDAAARAQVIFPDDHSPQSGPGATWSTFAAHRKANGG